MPDALHVTNGDAVVPDIARAVGISPEDVLPWRDVLHDGPVPDGLDPRALAEVRARHLADRGWTTYEAALEELCRRDERLAAHPEDAEVVLWFEDDLYDALQLAQVADRLTGRPGPVSLVRLRHPPRGDLRAAYDAREPYAPQPQAFAALRSPDPREWDGHAHMDRLLEELPDSGTGLSRLEREILEGLADRPLTPHALFLRVSHHEQPPWLGDSALLAVAADLRPLVALDGGHWQLREEGAAVLDGRAVRPLHDHWIGGVHLAADEPRWAYDAETRAPVRLD